MIQPPRDSEKRRGNMLAHARPVRTRAIHRDLFRLGKQAIVPMGDDLHHILRKPALEKLYERADLASAPRPHSLPSGFIERSNGNLHFIDFRATDKCRNPAAFDL